MLDSAANNVFLESMACGTPVMTNREGGVPEYIADTCNVLMPPDAAPGDWTDRLLALERNRGLLEAMRPATRAWAERFDWHAIADDYRTMYASLFEA